MYNDLVFVKNKKEYWKYLLVVSCFYILPSIQFVIFQETLDHDDLCYYNKKCKHPLGIIGAFNNVISNIFYCIFGLIFIGIVYYSTKHRHVHHIDMDPSLYYTLGIGLFMEGIFSGIFHICPSKLNFQFDTTFIFIGIIIMFLIIYQKRHPNKLPTPFKTYLLLATLVFINIIPLFDSTKLYNIWSWGTFYILTLYILVSGTIQLYLGDVLSDHIFENDSISLWRKFKILYEERNHKRAQLALVLLLNLATLAMLILGHIYKEKLLFTDWVLCLFVINLIIYIIYYIAQKINHREHIYIHKWMLLVITISLFIASIICFETPVSDKTLSHNESDALNKDCVLFDYWDYHDIWHILSSFGIFTFMCLVYYIDTDTYYLYNGDDNTYPVF